MKLIVACFLVCTLLTVVRSSPIPEVGESAESEVSPAEEVDSSDPVRDKRAVNVAVGTPTILGQPIPQPFAALAYPINAVIGPSGIVPVAGVLPAVAGPLSSLLALPRNLISTVGLSLESLG